MKKIRIHYFQHIPFEGLGSIEEWIETEGHSMTATKFFDDEKLPELNDFDWLIIMGGSMSVNDEKDYPWLAAEKKFIKRAIDDGKTVIGICLGSQLVSASLGAKVYKNKEKEIGWFDIELSRSAQSGELFFDMGTRLKVFQWHGDTFDLPQNAIHLASSAACKNQAYIYKDKVLALQFHLEPTRESLLDMLEGGIEEQPGRFIQSEKEIMDSRSLIGLSRENLFKLLTRLALKTGS
jgi:GMP synthase-like glutamine amidotransferase